MSVPIQIRRLESDPDDSWDALCRRTRCPWHSVGFARVQREFGTRPIFLLAHSGSELLGGVSLYLAGSRRFRLLDRAFARTAYIPDGPMVASRASEVAPALLTAVREELESQNAVAAAWRVETPGRVDAAALESVGFATTAYGVGVLELPPSPDEVDGVIHSKSRNLVRKAVREGVRVELAARLEEFLGLVDLSYRRSGLPVRNHRYIEIVHRLPGAEVLVARRADQAIAAVMWLPFGDVGLYLFHGRADGDTAGASNLLLREMFVRAIAQGVRIVHAGDVALAGDEDPHRAGITHFKTRMGFRVVPTVQGSATLRPLASAVRDASLRVWARLSAGGGPIE